MNITFSWTLISEYYDGCAELARQVYIVKTVKKTYSGAQSGGIDTHKAIDEHIRSHALLPDQLAWLKPTIDAFRQAGELKSEVQLAVDRYLNPCSFWSAKNGADPYVRGKWDVALKNGRGGFLVDWKDGKRYEKDGQLELGALLWMRADPELDQVTGINFWLQEKASPMGPPYAITRAQESRLWGEKWLPRLREIESKNASEPWSKNPAPFRCKTCPITTCIHNMAKAA